ncbi:hypothetical protein [Halococcus salsus]|uniref:hypothetical protein n=1 Tax=Halococcus salsus TaxID=2162894 RepID=UPI0018656DE8|nr:hypothetical protein [Halococcus salsus]
MTRLVSVGLAVVATLAMAGGVALMTAERFGLAGALFLSASIVIYARERWT